MEIKRIFKVSVISLLALILTVAAVLFAFDLRNKTLNDVRNEAIAELESRKGEYDESSIVLYNTTPSEAKLLSKKMGAELRITSDGSFATLTLTDGRTISDILLDDDYLRYVSSLSADFGVYTCDVPSATENMRPNAPLVTEKYKSELAPYHSYLNVGSTWSSTVGSGVTVAVIDTGIDTDHPEFSGRISDLSYNASEDKIVRNSKLSDGSYDWSVIEDVNGHGTQVAGVIAAGLNESGTVGVASDATLIVIKVDCDENGRFYRTSDLVYAIYYAIDSGADVINMSFGAYAEENPFESAIKLAYKSGIVSVASAGNESTATLSWPAADENVIGVGALENDGWGLADYSNYGENLDFVAPGTVYTTALDGSYTTSVGTSFSAPAVKRSALTHRKR